MTTTVHRVRYVCTNPRCRAEDFGKYFDHERIVPYINCWQCGAGRGMQPDQMIQMNQGMKLEMPEPGTQAVPLPA